MDASIETVMDTLALEGVHVESLDPTLDFLDLVARFAHRPGTVALLSGGSGDCARYHLLGVRPWLTLTGRPGKAHMEINGRKIATDITCFDLLNRVVNRLRLPDGIWPAPMAAGLMGYLAYDLKDELEDLPRTSVDDLQLPAMYMVAPSLLVVDDRRTGIRRLMVPLRSNASPPAADQVAEFYRILETPGEPGSRFRVFGEPVSDITPQNYRAAVQQVVDYIAAGDIYQANLSQCFQTAFDGDGFDLLRRLFEMNPAAFFAFIQAGDHQIVSTSPERFILRKGADVETRPIKGTRPRGRDEAEDRAYREELQASAKDDAELSMIVDLLRNDLGKVCEAGSVRVSDHKRLEAYENVFHLVSIVEGRLEAHRSSVDLIRAAFPGGSITGCPKVRAMEIIDELERHRRHVYCGSIGYISFHDTLDLSIAIRTAILAGDTLRYSAGGGIVFDSDPQAEYEETLHKARTFAEACRETRRTSPSREAVFWFNGRLVPAAAARVPVSDQGVQYGYGFFETLGAHGGDVPLLDDHLQRFNATWEALMNTPPPDVTWDVIIAQVLKSNGLENASAAVKILATRGSRSTPPWDHTLMVSARPYRHRLAEKQAPGLKLGTYPHPRQSPLAAHKTLNYLYYLRAGHWALSEGFDEALILNPDGSVSETNTANLLLVDGREVVRPASSAVLPGVAGAAACRQLETWGYTIAQRPVLPEALLTCDMLLATNALMGAVPVTEIDGRSRSAGDDLWQRLNDAVMPGWRDAMLQ